MSCYFRWMKDTLDKAGIKISEENKKEVDRAIHSVLGVDYKNCSVTWKKAKERIAENEEKFIKEVKKTLERM